MIPYDIEQIVVTSLAWGLMGLVVGVWASAAYAAGRIRRVAGERDEARRERDAARIERNDLLARPPVPPPPAETGHAAYRGLTVTLVGEGPGRWRGVWRDPLRRTRGEVPFAHAGDRASAWALLRASLDNQIAAEADDVFARAGRRQQRRE